jgi:hypothetical protein
VSGAIRDIKNILELSDAAENSKKCIWRFRHLPKAPEKYFGAFRRCRKLEKTYLAFSAFAESFRKIF